MQLYIPKPCPASWEEMSPDGQGRHCAACAKTVVDFTKMTDEQVLQYLGAAAGSLCARVTATQMQRDFIPAGPGARASRSDVHRAAGRRFLYYGLSTLFALLAGTSGCDRRRMMGKLGPPAQVKVDSGQFVTTGVVIRLPQTDTLCLTVTNAAGRPIRGAGVVINGGKQNTMSDEQGRANLCFPDELNEVTIQVSAPGYDTRIFSIKRPGLTGEYPQIRVKVQMDEILMGDTINPVQRINPG